MFKKTYLIAVLAAAAFVLFVMGAARVEALNIPAFTIKQGGTGTSTLPSYGQFVVGGKNGEWEYVASSTIGGELLMLRLSTAGYRPHWVKDGAEAVRRAHEVRPKLVLLD